MVGTINCGGTLLDLSTPVVMGILNVTPDSFSDGGRFTNVPDALRQAEKMLAEGAAVIDVGGASSRPGADIITAEAEIARVVPVIMAIKSAFPEAIIAVDTWRAAVADRAVEAGAAIINDISAGQWDPEMFPLMARLNVPVILMHIADSPEKMHHKPGYQDIVTAVLDFLLERVHTLAAMGVKDIIIDPGFGFGKTMRNNYDLLAGMATFPTVIQRPVLAGLSRKSMIYKLLETDVANALNGTTALNMVALQQGAQILRVHDVKAAYEVIQLWKMLHSAGQAGD